MKRWSRVVSVICGLALAGCGTFPLNENEAKVEISKVKDAIECELAAVAADKRFHNRNIPGWRVKATLDLTLVTSVGVDGTVTFLLPYTASQVTFTPGADLGRKDTSIAHLEFSIPIPAALERFKKTCLPGPDPSGTAMGLAAWFEAALLAIRNDARNGGLSYTTEFEVTGNASARFGYTLLRAINTVNANSAGAGGKAGILGNHRLSVAVAPPPGKPEIIEVSVTNWPKMGLDGTTSEKRKSAPLPAVDDPRLNRLLDQQRPIRLQPGTR